MSSSTIKLENWLAVLHCDGMNIAKFKQYLQDDPSLQVLPQGLQPNWDNVTRDLKWLDTHPKAQILTCIDPEYPILLQQIPDAPPVLYILGDAACLNYPQLAIVGSRQCSIMGKQHAEFFARKFAELGVVITSGLAIGIDAASHKGALGVRAGQTIGVLAHGMYMIYPAQHSTLSEQIIAHGCLVSEYPLGIIPLPKNFPKRNRLISGLSLGVLIIEADLNSGSLHTAHSAIDQGRDIFAVPGPINLPYKRGCHRLIKEGAKLVDSLDDVLVELPALLNCNFRDKYAVTAKDRLREAGLSAQQQQLLDFIDYDSTSVDVIVKRTGLASGAVGAILSELELEGVITAVPGGYAQKSD